MNTTPIVWSGRTTAYEHKHSYDPDKPLSPDTKIGFRKVWFLDVQWSTCPEEVQDEVRALWRNWECGNDHYVLKLSVDDLKDCGLPTVAIQQYVKEVNPALLDDEVFLIHWWW